MVLLSPAVAASWRIAQVSRIAFPGKARGRALLNSFQVSACNGVFGM
jgi:hypothetical protein